MWYNMIFIYTGLIKSCRKIETGPLKKTVSTEGTLLIVQIYRENKKEVFKIWRSSVHLFLTKQETLLSSSGKGHFNIHLTRTVLTGDEEQEEGACVRTPYCLRLLYLMDVEQSKGEQGTQIWILFVWM